MGAVVPHVRWRTHPRRTPWISRSRLRTSRAKPACRTSWKWLPLRTRVLARRGRWRVPDVERRGFRGGRIRRFKVSVVESMTGAIPTTTGGYGVPDVGNISELAECSDRGLDNGDGECECFDGFRGLACEEQVALV